MYNNIETGKTRKWDMLLLIFLILAFIALTAITIYLVKERGEQSIEYRAQLSHQSLQLAELDSTAQNIASGVESSALLGVQNRANADYVNGNWKKLNSDSQTLERLIKDPEIKDTFYDKERTLSALGKLATEAADLASSNAYQHPVIDNYLTANASMDLIGNLLYSGDLDYINKAFLRIEDSTSVKETVFGYIQNFEDVLAVYESSAILDELQLHESAIVDIVTKALNLRSSIKGLQADIAKQMDADTQTADYIATPLGDIPSNAIYISLVLALVMLALSILVISKIIRDRAKSERANILQNQKNEEAIFEMLDVIYSLSEGDLTVQAKVTDHFTGTLADSFNMSVEELRELVKAVGNSSDRVASAVKTAIGYADEFTEASLSQAVQITDATNIVSHVTKAMLDVSTQTSAAVDIAMSSTEVARSGSERVRSTINGMDQIRDHIQETSKRIKRLGESSQEIGDVVELINDIADQTHILALNAAIQASAAGEAGKGFAVVADEVQRLAERTGNATSRVEGLVKTIQSDTNEAIFAMEKSTSEVVNGANLAERAGESLNEIESVSGRLAGLIQSVSQASREVSELGGQVQQSMDSVKQVSEKNVENTKTTKSSIVALEKLADELKSSISGFKID